MAQTQGQAAQPTERARNVFSTLPVFPERKRLLEEGSRRRFLPKGGHFACQDGQHLRSESRIAQPSEERDALLGKTARHLIRSLAVGCPPEHVQIEGDIPRIAHL